MNADTPNRLHNNPPRLETIFDEINAQLPTQMLADLETDIDRTKALVENAAKVPREIANEVEDQKATDIVSQMKKHIQAMNSRRLGINAAARKAKEIIDNVFNNHTIDPVQQAIDRIEPGQTKWKRIKAEKERREREEKERLAREEAERKSKEAEDAERRKREAEEARRKAEREEQEAKERAARAKEEARQAEERKRAAEQAEREAEKRRMEAEQRRQEEEKKAAESTRKREREAAERRAEQARKEVEEQARLKREAQERQDAETRKKREMQDQAERERQKAADAATDKALAKGDLSDAAKDSKTADALARGAERDAAKAARHADAGQSELTRARGDRGGQSSLRTVWKGEVADADKINAKTMAALWPHIPPEAIDTAIDRHVKVHKGAKELPGIRFYEADAMVTR